MEFREFVDSTEASAQLYVEQVQKLWKAKRDQILQHWAKLPPNLQIKVEPISSVHRGTRYRSDGIRLTGSPQFINAVLSRIKDIMAYENPETQVEVEFEQISSAKGFDPKYDTPKYVMYVHVAQRGLDDIKKDMKDKKKVKVPGVNGPLSGKRLAKAKSPKA